MFKSLLNKGQILSKRATAIAVVGVVMAVGVFILVHHSAKENAPLTSVAQTSYTAAATSPTPAPDTARPATTEQADVAPKSTPTEQPATTPTPTPTTPDYGEDPNSPGIYEVFNKATVMTEAGIPSDQQAAADTLINYLMNWRYQVSGMDADLCNILPLKKMASAGSDYVTNPVTQLSYCNQVAAHRFGGWQQALNAYLKSPNQAIFN